MGWFNMVEPPTSFVFILVGESRFFFGWKSFHGTEIKSFGFEVSPEHLKEIQLEKGFRNETLRC